MKKAKLKEKHLILIACGIIVALLIVAVVLTITNVVHIPGISRNTETVAVQRGDTLSTLLSDKNLTGADINMIDEQLRKCDVTALHADTDKLIVSTPTTAGAPDKLTLVCGPWKRVEINHNADGWHATQINITPEIRMVYKTGEIREGDSFYVAGMRAGIPEGILANMYDLLSFDVDFERDVRAGQEFSVLYEEQFADGQKAGNGAIIELSFDTLRGNTQMYRFKKSDGTFGYYDADGNGAVKAIKRTPLNNARITSSFSTGRKHPILGYTRAHKGVDFGAPSGTPIPAGGAGRVTEKRYNSGWGNYVTIKHNATYSTRYAHMSRFQRGVNVGTLVKQGQIIGYVGMTGLATGPHLHYEIIKNGAQVNPMTIKFPAIESLPAKDKPKFFALRDNINRAIKTLQKNPDMFMLM